MGHSFLVSPDFSGASSPQRTQSRRSSCTPAAAADWGSRASLASTTTQNSPRRGAAARAAGSKGVRPEGGGPQTLGRDPRGRAAGKGGQAGAPAENHYRRGGNLSWEGG